jgi:hypothetical protein
VFSEEIEGGEEVGGAPWPAGKQRAAGAGARGAGRQLCSAILCLWRGGARADLLPCAAFLSLPATRPPVPPRRTYVQVREALGDFYASNYTSCLNHLDRLRWGTACYPIGALHRAG